MWINKAINQYEFPVFIISVKFLIVGLPNSQLSITLCCWLQNPLSQGFNTLEFFFWFIPEFYILLNVKTRHHWSNRQETQQNKNVSSALGSQVVVGGKGIGEWGSKWLMHLCFTGHFHKNFFRKFSKTTWLNFLSADLICFHSLSVWYMNRKSRHMFGLQNLIFFYSKLYHTENLKSIGHTGGSRWDGSLWAASSGTTLFFMQFHPFYFWHLSGNEAYRTVVLETVLCSKTAPWYIGDSYLIF